ncbi:MAG: hypothetical protein OXH04_13360 [Acidobacteria bacterium]|nr:hypothetical protein [Acidobacteriota bacterium]
MLDTLATARTLADAGIEPAHADAITAAIRDAGESADTVTRTELARPDGRVGSLRGHGVGPSPILRRRLLRADLAALESRLTWRFTGIVLAQTGALLAAIIGTAITIVRMLGS